MKSITPILDKRIYDLKNYLCTLPIDSDKFKDLLKVITRLCRWRTEVKVEMWVEVSQYPERFIKNHDILKKMGLDRVEAHKLIYGERGSHLGAEIPVIEGEDEGSLCNRDGCEGIIELQEEPDGGCYCFTGVAPCSYCMSKGLTYCPECDWEMERP